MYNYTHATPPICRALLPYTERNQFSILRYFGGPARRSMIGVTPSPRRQELTSHCKRVVLNPLRMRVNTAIGRFRRDFTTFSSTLRSITINDHSLVQFFDNVALESLTSVTHVSLMMSGTSGRLDNPKLARGLGQFPALTSLHLDAVIPLEIEDRPAKLPQETPGLWSLAVSHPGAGLTLLWLRANCPHIHHVSFERSDFEVGPETDEAIFDFLRLALINLTPSLISLDLAGQCFAPWPNTSGSILSVVAGLANLRSLRATSRSVPAHHPKFFSTLSQLPLVHLTLDVSNDRPLKYKSFLAYVERKGGDCRSLSRLDIVCEPNDPDSDSDSEGSWTSQVDLAPRLLCIDYDPMFPDDVYLPKDARKALLDAADANDVDLGPQLANALRSTPGETASALV
ncbi:hypothetical protein JCM10212_002805 [Sporobolomyces blumeae]